MRTTAPTPCLPGSSSARASDTLIAKKTGAGQYRFDIRLQGIGETVILDM